MDIYFSPEVIDTVHKYIECIYKGNIIGSKIQLRTPPLPRSTILPTPPTTAGRHELLQPAATARRRSSPSGSPLFPSWIDSFNHWSVGGFLANNWMERLSSHMYSIYIFLYWFVAIFFLGDLKGTLPRTHTRRLVTLRRGIRRPATRHRATLRRGPTLLPTSTRRRPRKAVPPSPKDGLYYYCSSS